MAGVNFENYPGGGGMNTEEVLKLLEKEEMLLKEVMQQLKRELGQLLGEMVSKEEQVRKLTGRVAELKEGREKETKVNRWEGNLEVNHRFQYLFPEEIWRMILANLNLTDWKDRMNCSKSCELFQTILDPSKTTFVFDEVFPHLYKHLSGGEILNCRRVCQAWKAGVDGFLESPKSLPRPHKDEDSDPRYPSFVVNPMVEKGLGQLYTSRRGGVAGGWQGPSSARLQQDNVERLEGNLRALIQRRAGRRLIRIANQQLWEARELARRIPPTAFDGMLEDELLRACSNPFIGRDVYVDVDRGTLNVVRRFLAAFGNQIKSLTVAYSSDRELTRLGTECPFRSLPNLHKLRLIRSTTKVNSQEEEEQDVTLDLESPAPNLESLQIDDDVEPASTVSLALLQKYYVQLRRLHVKASYFDRVSSLDWSNLVELHLKCFSESINQYKELFKTELPNLKKVGFIHQAKSSDPLYNPNGASPSNRFVELINHLSINSRLNTLRISGQLLNSFIGTVQSSPSYAPPTLKTLELEHSRSRRRGPDGTFAFGTTDVTCYDFLLNFPFLENLNLFWRKQDLFGSDSTTSEIRLVEKSDDFVDPWYTHPYCKTKQEMEIEEKGEWEAVEVHKYVYTGEMYKSNLWKVLPKLKVLTFQNQVYTREDYEKFQEQQQQHGERK